LRAFKQDTKAIDGLTTAIYPSITTADVHPLKPTPLALRGPIHFGK